MKNPRYPAPRRVLLTLDQKALCTLSSAFSLQFVVAWAWLYSYLANQQLDFEFGKPLAKALHDLPSQIMGEDNRRGQLVERINASVTRTLVGDDIGDGLGLPSPKWRYGVLVSVPILFGLDTARAHNAAIAKRLEQFRAKRQDNMNWWLKKHDNYYQ
jgi:hypothetical protein